MASRLASANAQVAQESGGVLSTPLFEVNSKTTVDASAVNQYPSMQNIHQRDSGPSVQDALLV